MGKSKCLIKYRNSLATSGWDVQETCIVRLVSYNWGRGSGFKAVKAKILDCLEHGDFSHEQRGDIDIKNLLAIGQVPLSEAAEILGRARGYSYSSSPHNLVASIDVHVVKARHAGQDWYIKWYFADPGSVFASVHH